jgi:hypothetical protein
VDPCRVRDHRPRKPFERHGGQMRPLSASILAIPILVVSPLAAAAVEAGGYPRRRFRRQERLCLVPVPRWVSCCGRREMSRNNRALMLPSADRRSRTALMSAYISGRTVRARFDGCHGGSIRVTGVEVKP